MQDLTVKRTLVKSPPELWSELSEVERLAKHLDAFGEIKITRLEPESTVAWEGEGASGTVSIEPSGWGTKVTLTARVEGEEPAPEPEPVAEPPAPVAVAALAEPEAAQPEAAQPEAAEPEAVPSDPVEPSRRGLFSRLFGREPRRPAPAAGGEDQPVWVAGAPQAEPEVAAEPEPVAEREPVAEPEPVQEPQPVVEAPIEAPAGDSDGTGTIGPQRAQAALEGVLEALGSAHHRPFSRG